MLMAWNEWRRMSLITCGSILARACPSFRPKLSHIWFQNIPLSEKFKMLRRSISSNSCFFCSFCPIKRVANLFLNHNGLPSVSSSWLPTRCYTYEQFLYFLYFAKKNTEEVPTIFPNPKKEKFSTYHPPLFSFFLFYLVATVDEQLRPHLGS